MNVMAWMDRNANVSNVGPTDYYAHLRWAREYLDSKNIPTNKDSIYETMFDFGFVRIYQMGAHLYFEHNKAIHLTEKQKGELKNLAIENHLGLMDFGGNQINLSEYKDFRIKDNIYTHMKYRNFFKKKMANLVERSFAANDLDDDSNLDIGLPKRDGALDIPHRGQPIHMSKIVQVGKQSGIPASGEVSGYKSVVPKSNGGEDTLNQPGDKEHITAGDEKVDKEIVTKSVGGPVTQHNGKTDRPNSLGKISNTPKNPKINSSSQPGADQGEDITIELQEARKMIRGLVKDVLKEVASNSTANGTSYKIMGPQYRIQQDNLAREVQHTPELTETESAAYATGGNIGNKGGKPSSKNTEVQKAAKKLSEAEANGVSYTANAGRQYRIQKDDHAREVQHDPNLSEKDDGSITKYGGREVQQGHRGQAGFKNWICTGCGKNLTTKIERPEPIPWADGHVCRFVEEKNVKTTGQTSPISTTATSDKSAVDTGEMTEAGGQSIQTRSFRTIKDAPQNPKARQDDEVQESTQLNEKKDKWIQKAVNPAHKGYCTPMSKSTCTPHRKALAQRFKKGV